MTKDEVVGDTWAAPEVSTRTIRMLLLYFESTFGRAALEKAWAEHQLPLTLAFTEDVSNFVSVQFAERLCSALALASGDPQFLKKAAATSASPGALGFAFYMLRAIGDPKLLYEKTVELGTTYNRVGTFTIEASGPTDMTLAYRSRVAEHGRNLCITRQATLAGFPCIWNLPEAEVIESSCQLDGADCCRYHLRWRSRAPVVWRRWALGVAGLAVAAALQLFLAGPNLALTLALGAVGTALGGWLDQIAIDRSTKQRFADQTQGMERSLVELQRRADDLHKANVELDQRVADRTRELSTALEQLRQLDALKTEFFANVSHELRTPLTLILTPVEDRLGEATDPVERRLLESLGRNGHRLLRLIDDLLDLTRIDAGHLRLDVGPVDAAALAKQLKTLFETAAQARGVKLAVEGAESTHDLWGDGNRLDSVLSNLLGNALKFTPEGGAVTVLVHESGEEVRISVRDTGTGIAPNDLPHIFDRYYQAAEPSGRRRGGVGIGLALSRNLVELHGGRIEVISEPGYGATFTVVLPKGRSHFRPEVLERRRVQLEVAEPRRVTDQSSDSLLPVRSSPGLQRPPGAPLAFEGKRKPRVLVVEDNPDMRAMLVDLLSPKLELYVAVDGRAGLEAVTRERPDLVLSDVMMPRMSGTELCVAIKSDPVLANTPVVLLTARGGTDAAVEGLGAGADEFVEKPFHPRVLMARIEAQLRLRALSLQLSAHARLAAVGTLAAGVGHEVRNPVNAVLNGVRALQSRPGLDAADQRLLEVISDGADRINRISGALLTHASPGDGGGARPVNAREGLDSTLRLMQHRLSGVAVHSDYSSEAMVVASAVELNQIFANLIDNGLRAKAKNLWLSVADVGDAVQISVADDGQGVPPEVAPRLFDPFYTTRAPGEGTGLGLYLSKQSAQRWGGDLTFAPRPGGGTTFTLALPRERT